MDDLELLFVCGTPGHMPDELIDAEWEGGRVFLDNADTIARPLRLGVDEAAGPDRRAARPGRGPRAGGARRRRPRPGQARAGHRRSAAAAARGPGRHRRATSRPSALADRPHARSARHRAAAPALPRAAAATRRPSATSTPCAWSTSTRSGTSRAGATAPRAPGCSGSTGSSRIEVLDVDGTPAGGGRSRGTSTPASSRPAPNDLLVTLRLSRGPPGSADYYPTERVERLAEGGSLRCRCAPPTRPGCAGCCGGSGSQATVLEPAALAAEVRAARRRPCAPTRPPT